MAITRTTWTDGSTVINNARLQAIYDAIETAWALDTYTPSWTASSVNPAIGNGTITGRYISLGGKAILFAVNITAGSTTTFGTGTYSVSLPLSANNTFAGLVNVFAVDVSTSTIYNGVGAISTTTTVGLFTTDASAASGYSPTVPIATPATGDVWHIFGVYFRS
jgi:hypothetical protein